MQAVWLDPWNRTRFQGQVSEAELLALAYAVGRGELLRVGPFSATREGLSLRVWTDPQDAGLMTEEDFVSSVFS